MCNIKKGSSRPEIQKLTAGQPPIKTGKICTKKTAKKLIAILSSNMVVYIKPIITLFWGVFWVPNVAPFKV